MPTKKEAFQAIADLTALCEDAMRKAYGTTNFSLTNADYSLNLLRSFIETNGPTDCECDELPNSRHCPKHNEPIGQDAVDDVVRAFAAAFTATATSRLSSRAMHGLNEQMEQLKSALLRMIRR